MKSVRALLCAVLLGAALTAFPVSAQSCPDVDEGYDAYFDGDYEEALEVAECLLDEDSEDVDALLLQGDALRSLGEYEDALESFEAALDIDDDNGEVYAGLASAYYELGDYEAALENAEEAVDRLPDSAYALVLRADSNAALGNYPDALEDYDAVIAINPDVAYNWAQRANTRIYTGDYEGALEDADQALELADGDYAFAHAVRGDALFFMGEFEDAAEAYTDALDVFEDYARAFASRAAALTRLGEIDDAIDDAEQAIDIFDDYAYAYSALGDAYYFGEEYADAIDAYEQAIELDEYRLADWIRMALCVALEGDGVEAGAILDEMWANNEDFVVAEEESEVGDSVTLQVVWRSLSTVTFEGEEGMTITVSAISAQDGAVVDPVLALYDPEGASMFVASRANPDGTAEFTTELPSDGTYMLALTAAESGAEGEVEVTIGED